MIVLTVGPASLARLMRRDAAAPGPPALTADDADEGRPGWTETPAATGRP